MKDRIKALRKDQDMTQTEFASKLSLSQNFIAQVESGKKNPSDRTILDISREFGVNEKWLLTGEGEMYKLIEDETAAIVSDLLEEENPLYDLILQIAKTYQQLDDKSQAVLLNFSKELLENLKKEG